MSFGPTKRKPSDAAFSDCVRMAKNWNCERCGRNYSNSKGSLHCSHIYPRTHRTLRWCKDNAQALCVTCHSWYHSHPTESGKWVEEILGEAMVELLIEKKNSKVRVSKLEEKDIAKHYREQLKLLEDGAETFISWQ